MNGQPLKLSWIMFDHKINSVLNIYVNISYLKIGADYFVLRFDYIFKDSKARNNVKTCPFSIANKMRPTCPKSWL